MRRHRLKKGKRYGEECCLRKKGIPEMNQTIAIDGPAGAGKSTIAKRVSNMLGYHYVDTGAMYRTLALALLRAGISEKDEEAVEKTAGGTCHHRPDG